MELYFIDHGKPEPDDGAKYVGTITVEIAGAYLEEVVDTLTTALAEVSDEGFDDVYIVEDDRYEHEYHLYGYPKE